MATQICPNCNKDSFTWMLDNEKSELTIWNCSICFYEAFENENDEQICTNCEKETKTKLKDAIHEYWWCSNCNLKS
ncbi:hypothetical protein [uncultured Kordia sp.]|uniref:hypothetical protein n=1 Tax=uncultured Kordia sp. TaxID=507699 RepID=UPI00262EDFCB|nr:hypothetical protein [uncultured Kordia sp.]